MNRKNYCPACSAIKFDLKTRRAITHTCGKEGYYIDKNDWNMVLHEKPKPQPKPKPKY